MMKRTVTTLLIFMMLTSVCGIASANENTVTMYSLDGRTITVDVRDVEAYKAVGWYTGSLKTLYSLDGRTAQVSSDDVPAWLSVGWYTEPVTTVYAPDGRSSIINKSDVDAWLSVGWYAEPVTTVYAPDGRSSVIKQSELSAWLSVGWYAEPVTTVYSLDGRTLVIPQNQIAEYESVGWYKELPIQTFCITDREKYYMTIISAYNPPEWSPEIESEYDYSYSCEYAYYDIDKDGSNELITRTGSSDDCSFTFDFYTYIDGSVVKIGSEFAGIGDLHSDGSNLIVHGVLHGGEWVNRITYVNGIFNSEQIVERSNESFYDEHRWPVDINLFDCSELSEADNSALSQTFVGWYGFVGPCVFIVGDFTVHLPESWRYKYICDFLMYDSGGYSMKFYEKHSYETHSGGELFSLNFVPADAGYLDENGEECYKERLTVSYPHIVRYLNGSPYLEMQKDIPQILRDIEYRGDCRLSY